jgi:hypothetical protein
MFEDYDAFNEQCKVGLLNGNSRGQRLNNTEPVNLAIELGNGVTKSNDQKPVETRAVPLQACNKNQVRVSKEFLYSALGKVWCNFSSSISISFSTSLIAASLNSPLL